jgi:excisionase family DNA binding protein
MPNVFEETGLPTDGEVELAPEAAERLSQLVGKDLRIRVVGSVGNRSAVVRLPGVSVRMLVRVLTELAAGRQATMVGTDAHLTTGQAAQLLGLSPPTVIKLVNQGHLRYHRIGTHRRVRFLDVMVYKRQMEQGQADPRPKRGRPAKAR